MPLPPKATTTVASKLLGGLDTPIANPLACVSLPDPVNVDFKPPIIAIPGQTRIWQEPNFPLRLSPDRGYTFIDQNAWRCRESPLEPLFRSILITQQLIGNTSFSLSKHLIDVVTDRNNLRKLCAMVRSIRLCETLTPSKNREFRIDAQLAPNGRTLLLTRYSPEPRKRVNPGDTGYGTNFEHATTSNYTPVLVSSHGQSRLEKFSPTSYHRVAKYSLADLNLLVRYEVDAVQHVPPIDDTHISKQPPSEQRIETQPHSTLCHIISGTLSPQDHAIELKTSKLRWARAYPQLYFSQTPILKVGIHRNGNFSRVENYMMDQIHEGPAAESSREMIDNLRFLVPILKQMQHACQQHGRSGNPLAFFWSGDGPLKLYEIKHPKRSYSLPKDILASPLVN
ncbi:hypothetical protein OPQ81_006753 [Rhizoctonia solani]|nr:hypothetical protein OPQ81_006753 [Rhizoctonia solani]